LLHAKLVSELTELGIWSHGAAMEGTGEKKKKWKFYTDRCIRSYDVE